MDTSVTSSSVSALLGAGQAQTQKFGPIHPILKTFPEALLIVSATV